MQSIVVVGDRFTAEATSLERTRSAARESIENRGKLPIRCSEYELSATRRTSRPCALSGSVRLPLDERPIVEKFVSLWSSLRLARFEIQLLPRPLCDEGEEAVTERAGHRFVGPIGIGIGHCLAPFLDVRKSGGTRSRSNRGTAAMKAGGHSV
jgi:hypothetical protein